MFINGNKKDPLHITMSDKIDYRNEEGSWVCKEVKDYPLFYVSYMFSKFNF
jgi:hypothetical protein